MSNNGNWATTVYHRGFYKFNFYKSKLQFLAFNTLQKIKKLNSTNKENVQYAKGNSVYDEDHATSFTKLDCISLN